ncbi:MAG: hypothetical protein ACRD88_08345, partial [Terriglobia bacterium]
CAACAARVRDVNRLRWEARQLLATEEPPDRLWLSLRRELDKEGLLRKPGPQSWLSAVLTFGWLPRLPMGLAYASVFLLALVGVEFVRDRVTPAPPPASLPPTAMVQTAERPASPAAEPSLAEAPRRDETVGAARAQVAGDVPSAIRRGIEKAPPEQRAILVRNWQQINSSVGELQRFVAEHPDDLQVLWQLGELQEQETLLREWLMRWELEGF